VSYITKGVTFNLSDPDQKELYEYAMRSKNFSGKMKRLLEKERAEKNTPQRQVHRGGIQIDLT
jgi:hypothetical protein